MSREVVTGQEVAGRKEPPLQPRAPLIGRPRGASLMYVNTFCVEIFGPGATLETCR